MKMNKVKLSIIIPHHNTPDLLQKCLDSIPDRQDVQIIVVDDNSDSDVVNFDAFPGADRNNVTAVFDKSSKGAGHARNVGVSLSEGTWLTFCDSDDYFNTEILDEVIDDTTLLCNDVVYFNINCLDIETLEPRPNADLYYNDYIKSPINAIDKCKYQIKVPWGKFIKRDLVENNNIVFDETRVGNDAWFSLMVGYYSKQAVIDERVLYNWMVRSGSITSNKSLDALLIHVDLASRISKFKEAHDLTEYRGSMFVMIPSLVRAGMNPFAALLTILRKTSKKFWFRDIIYVMVAIFNKKR